MAGTPVAPYQPRLTQGLPGGSLILDENLLLIKKVIGHLSLTVNQISYVVNLGPTGTPRGGGTTFDFGDNIYSANDPGGAETWLAERMCPFVNATAGTCSVSLAALASSSAGPGFFFVRAGGTTGLPDGTLVGGVFTFGATLALVTSSVSMVNPGDTRLIKITGKPSAAGQSAQIASISLSVK